MGCQTKIVELASGTIRADKFLADSHPEFSRAALAKLFTLNMVNVNEESIKPGERLRDGVEVEYNLSPLSETPEVIDLPIVFEDDNVVVVNKPAGIISHARGKFWQEASVASFIRNKVSISGSGERAGIVHRLDRATSGVMICAKNEETLKYLQKQFHDRQVSKTYVAIVRGKPKNEDFVIDAAIERNPKLPKQFMVSTSGKSAQTRITMLNNQNMYSRLEMKPKTGRTHQLRVHLKYISLPIVGDELYGGHKGSRLMLHAQKLELMLPDGKTHTFTSDLPEEFNDYA